jgi:hypothetical protein
LAACNLTDCREPFRTSYFVLIEPPNPANRECGPARVPRHG